ncbi:Rec8 like protein-domain-containing protein [Schizophyllum commune]
MFFTQELLSKRDSGFGLLWLAATLGSRSAFKKLPKRSVLNADIAQLCDLIAEPMEPLALRLSSNLMVGVARVYKVKQEMLYTDVSNCVTSLKKVVVELRSLNDDQLQMAQPTVRAGAVTLTLDPANTYAIDFDTLVADWDDFLNINRGSDDRMDLDDDYDPKAGRKGRGKGGPAVLEDEVVRGDKYTLREHHDHLLSASYDLTFSGADPSSSQVDHSFILQDDIFDVPDAFDLGGLGDELARELGEGWGASPTRARATEPGEFEDEFRMDVDMSQPFNMPDLAGEFGSITVPETPRKKRSASARAKENQPPSSARRSRPPSRALTPRGVSPATSFSRQFLSQEDGANPLLETTRKNDEQDIAQAPKKLKRGRLLLDARTELSDEELRMAREQYVAGQAKLKKEQAQKQAEKASEKMIEELVWGAPNIVQAPALADFWQEAFRVQVEAKSGESQDAGGRSRKRRRTDLLPVPEEDEDRRSPGAFQDMDAMQGMGAYEEDQPFFGRGVSERHSSEDPGQARRMSSRPGSQLDFLAAQAEFNISSQRSSLFPWDHAGFMSSSGAPMLPGEGSDKISVDQVSIRLPGGRNSSIGPRDGSLGGSLPPSVAGGPGGSAIAFSPGPVGEDFRFDVDAVQKEAFESQLTDANLITLERNSFNFLEYARMQSLTLGGGKSLTFDTVVPKDTSTRHVAAAGFYHCLVLGTKNLLRIDQQEAYGSIRLEVI